MKPTSKLQCVIRCAVSQPSWPLTYSGTAIAVSGVFWLQFPIPKEQLSAGFMPACDCFSSGAVQEPVHDFGNFLDLGLKISCLPNYVFHKERMD